MNPTKRSQTQPKSAKSRSAARPGRAPATATAEAEQKRRVESSQPETILLAVTGMSPAVLTETVWALAHAPEPVVPSRVIVLTTAAGRDEINKCLFQPLARFGGQTPWDTLLAALQQQNHQLQGRLRFGLTPDDIRVMTCLDPNTHLSRELTDIRTPADNEAAADFLLEQVRAVVENPDTHLVASIAGGRKTMGALLYACLTLLGRETDRLTHVLVNEPFETIREFFFPGQPGGAVRDRDGREHAPAQARVDLADVPFVPLRNLFARELGRKAGTFSHLVGTCCEQIRKHLGENLRLSLDCARTELEVNGASLRLAPREHAVLLFLATRAKQGEPPIGAYKDAATALNLFCEQLRASARQGDLSDWRGGESLKTEFDEQDIRRALSGIRAKLIRRGGDASQLTACLPQRGRCSLDVPGPLIHLKR
jgi:CRISPR-associated protein (TIGR02584 family)